MKTITKYAFFILTVALAFGSFNPFDMRGIGSITEQVEEQRGYTPLLFAACILLSLIDKNVIRNYKTFKQYYTPLLVLFVLYIFSSLVFDISTALDGYMFYIKLLVAFTGFFSYAMYFSEYPEVLKTVCRLFGLLCAGICLMFFLGFLDGFYYFSNGRLWLFGENPNSYSFVLGFGALLLGKELLDDNKLIYRILYAFGILLIMAYTFMSGSRGTLMFLGLSFLIIYSSYVKKHLGASLVTVFAGVIILNFIFSKNVEELSVLDRFSDLQSGDSREDLMKNALGLFFDSPLFGYGANGYDYMKATVFHDMRDSHNMIISILATTGLLGFSAIATFFKRVIKLLWSNIAQNKVAISLFVYVFLISMKTGGIITYSMMWFAYSLIIALVTKFKTINK